MMTQRDGMVLVVWDETGDGEERVRVADGYAV